MKFRTICRLILLAGGGVVFAAEPPTFVAPRGVQAKLTDAGHIDLHWQNAATAAGGNFLEFNLGAEQEFSLLAMVASEITHFRHPDVARETRFNYRLTPFFGPRSEQAVITTGAAPTPLARDEVDGPLKEPTRLAASGRKLRAAESFAAATATEVAAALRSPTTVDVRWTDNAADEDGYLVEVSADGGKNWSVCALLPPDTTSFRKTQLPAATKLHFAVRVFFHGPSSAIVSINVPPEKNSGAGGSR